METSNTCLSARFVRNSSTASMIRILSSLLPSRSKDGTNRVNRKYETKANMKKASTSDNVYKELLYSLPNYRIQVQDIQSLQPDFSAF
jgi:hypothetical protein